MFILKNVGYLATGLFLLAIGSVAFGLICLGLGLISPFTDIMAGTSYYGSPEKTFVAFFGFVQLALMALAVGIAYVAYAVGRQIFVQEKVNS